MKSSSSAWQRLVTAARQAPEPGDDAAPFGFAARVAAHAMEVERPNLQTLLNRLALPALSAALAIMMVSIAANYSALTTSAETEQEMIDPVAEVLTLS